VDTNLSDALAGIESVVEPQLQARRISFRNGGCDPTLFVRADKEKLRQILVNLLSNAAKYTPEGGSVVIDCDSDDERVRVHVRDTGPGIAPERMDVIFEPFVQGERALSKPNEGVGLGLTISRDLARGMGAEVSVESERGRGATFTVTLDRARVHSSGGSPGAMRDVVASTG
jgi:signal transduction histidine kinase